VLRAVAWWAFGSLPGRLRAGFGVRWNPAKEAAMRANLRVVRTLRPAIPPRFRYILPAHEAARRAGIPVSA
jgi:uncharacterized protein (DUF2236 family)